MIDRLENYLVGKEGYLKSDLSNGKVIMLSGKWGSGKTHFWQNRIATEEFKKSLHKKRETYAYVSLYGKSSIEEIENDIFSQAYSLAIGGENFVTKGFSTFTKRMKRFGSSKIGKGLQEEQKDNIERSALARLNNGGVICFDDFERKSKSIDLNDLFGFITQLTLNFNCKVVIILNDDVFKGEEKKIFSNVKEKTVSKFLYYSPTIEELFDLILVDNESNKYSTLFEHRYIILKAIEDAQQLNARIYIQVLDNLLEWKLKQTIDNEYCIQYFVYLNINFILYHTIIDNNSGFAYLVPEDFTLLNKNARINEYLPIKFEEADTYQEFINEIKRYIQSNNQLNQHKDLYISVFENNEEVFKSIFFFAKLIRPIRSQIKSENQNKIINFIKTGILD